MSEKYVLEMHDIVKEFPGVKALKGVKLQVRPGTVHTLMGENGAGNDHADPANSGLSYELDAVAAATVGGTSHAGGICKVSGVFSGILILGVINNGLVLMGVDDNMTNIIKGIIIIGAVVLDMRKNAKRA